MAIDALTMDALGEIGNIGTGNAASALSTMLDSKVDIGLPKCAMVPFSEITNGFSSPEELVVGVLVQLSGDMDGFIMMVLTVDSAFELLKLLTGRLQPTEGAVTIGTNVAMTFLDQLRGELNPELTVGENIASDRDEVIVGGV